MVKKHLITWELPQYCEGKGKIQPNCKSLNVWNNILETYAVLHVMPFLLLWFAFLYRAYTLTDTPGITPISPWRGKVSAVIYAAQLCGQGADVTSAAYWDMEEGELIYDNSYNMPPVTHYHPHQTTTERKRIIGYNTDHTERQG